jgi:hypothetical protein
MADEKENLIEKDQEAKIPSGASKNELLEKDLEKAAGGSLSFGHQQG